MPKLHFAMVCASNMNRSMEAHKVLQEHGFEVKSFGVGRTVKLPGVSKSQPNTYPFGKPYADIHADLLSKDEELYTRNGLLAMVKRNMGVKTAPEKWQENTMDEFDVALTFEERVMDQLVADMNQRQKSSSKELLIINMDVKDNHDEAATAAQEALKLCQWLEESEDWVDHVDNIVTRFEEETGRRPIYSVMFY